MGKRNNTEGGDPLRPKHWDDFIGQHAVKSRLETAINAAIIEMRALEPVLLAGPPGFGKTSLAQIIASKLGDEIEFVTLSAGMSASMFIGIIERADACILLDELHLASAAVQSHMLTLLEAQYIQLPNGRRIERKYLTIIGATTERQKIIGPLMDRWMIKPEFDPYSASDLAKIVLGLAERVGITINDKTARALGKASGGTPRNAKALVLSARNLSYKFGRPATAAEVLDECQVDTDGLSVLQMRYLRYLYRSTGEKAGLRSLSSHLRLCEAEVMKLEQLLDDMGLIEFSGQGRSLSTAGRRKVEPTSGTQRRRLAVV
jgi:Holliday junction DNA helicase RuvB